MEASDLRGYRDRRQPTSFQITDLTASSSPKSWSSTLRSLAAHLEWSAQSRRKVIWVDGKRHWSRAGNVCFIAAIQLGMYAMGAPMRMLAKPFRRPTEPR